MTERDREPLAPEVLRRKVAIFGDLTGILEARVRARRSRRATVAASILGAVLLVLAATISRVGPQAARHEPLAHRPPSTDPLDDPRFTIVHAIADAPNIDYIDDDELVAELRAAGFRGGFARADRQVFVATR
ncbi:MAG: hypothetical protein U0572_12760 [Phycisphaerales bacterium]